MHPHSELGYVEPNTTVRFVVGVEPENTTSRRVFVVDGVGVVRPLREGWARNRGRSRPWISSSTSIASMIPLEQGKPTVFAVVTLDLDRLPELETVLVPVVVEHSRAPLRIG